MAAASFCDTDEVRNSRVVRIYQTLPLNVASRLWGKLHRRRLPSFARSPAYKLYSRVCSCNLDEADCNSLKDYRSLSEFFKRQLKPGVRSISGDSQLVSPVDGRVLSFGRVTDGEMEQVKGVKYTVQGFLGPQDKVEVGRVPDSDYHQRLLVSEVEGRQLWHCCIYLSPGDYHGFHSPTDWQINRRRHFPGHLLSVLPKVAGLVRGLFCLNERAVYQGEWANGFFCFAAVGATNVGSIRVYRDEELRTNRGCRRYRRKTYHDKEFQPAFTVVKGEAFGEFNLGSTIVLLFEAPPDFEFSLEAGQKIRVGEPMGNL